MSAKFDISHLYDAAIGEVIEVPLDKLLEELAK
jgi:hypothetical protein